MPTVKYKPIIKRIPTSIDRTKNITTYDIDNLYPQRMEQLANRSPITLSSTDAMYRFIRGAGFSDNGDLVVNRFGQTLNDILKAVVKDSSVYDGWALHINVNILGGITEIIPVKFKTVRFGLPDKYGRHTDVKTSLYWDKLSNGYSNKLKLMREFPIWERRDETPVESVEDFEGYIHYDTPEMDEYPKASFDAVADSAQTNAEIQTFELGSIQNSFLGTSIFKHPGKIESEKDREQIIADLHDLTGAENAGSAYLLEVPEDFDGTIIENLPANNNDRLFELTNTNSVERIIARFGIPAPILGIQPSGGGIFNEDQIKDAYTYMNARTVDKRNDMKDSFNKILKDWHTGAIDIGDIEVVDFEVPTQETKEVIQE